MDHHGAHDGAVVNQKALAPRGWARITLVAGAILSLLGLGSYALSATSIVAGPAFDAKVRGIAHAEASSAAERVQKDAETWRTAHEREVALKDAALAAELHAIREQAAANQAATNQRLNDLQGTVSSIDSYLREHPAGGIVRGGGGR